MAGSRGEMIMTISEFRENIPTFIEQAIATGKKITEGKTVLSPSLSRISDLDGIIEYLHSLWEKKLISDDVAWNVSVPFGVLLGEMIINEHHFHWVMKDGLPVVETDEGNQLSPITKVNKIITDEDSSEGSPTTFYEGFLALQKYQNMSDEEKERITTYISGHETIGE